MAFKILLGIYVFMTILSLLSLSYYRKRMNNYFDTHGDITISYQGRDINIRDIATEKHIIRCFIPVLRLPIFVYTVISDESFDEQVETTIKDLQELLNKL